MKYNIIDFAKKQDEHFLINNSKLNSEGFNRKFEHHEILIAKINNQSVGYLVYDYLWHHIPFISFIWVDDKYRKIGIGGALLDYLEKFLITKGYNDLFSSSEENAKEAKAWHRHMDFKDCGSILEINNDNTGEIFFKKSL